MPPRVTIGVPCYNNAGTIARTIRSIRQQSFGDWRAIVSDDGSADGTLAEAEAAIGGDARFEIVRQPVRRGTMNFREPLRRAASPYFAWLAGDDYWYPDFLARTLAALEAEPGAVGAVAQCLFEKGGRLTGERPGTGPLSGSWAERVCGFLAEPNGTRMYGLFRTGPLRAAFPGRAMVGYDWALMIAVLREGDLVEVPEPLLVRDRTPWERYAEEAARAGRHPLRAMALHLIARGRFPPSRAALAALVRLDRAKREEAIYVTDPAGFLTGLKRFARHRLPLSGNPVHLVRAARAVLDGQGKGTPAAKTALGVLRNLAEAGDPAALRAYGRLIAEHGEGGTPSAEAWPWFRAAAASGDADDLFALIEYERAAGLAELRGLAARYLAAGEKGSGPAAARAGFLLVRGLAGSVDEWRLHGLLEEARSRGVTTATHPLAWMTEHGRGCRADPGRALRLYEEAALTNPSAHRDLARLARGRGAREDADRHYAAAVEAGMDWSAVDRVALWADAAPGEGHEALEGAALVLARSGEGPLGRRLARVLSEVPEARWIAYAAGRLGLPGPDPVAVRDRLVEEGCCRPGRAIGPGVALALAKGG